MTNTKRVSGAVSGGQTSRVTEAPELNRTARVSGTPAGGDTEWVSILPRLDDLLLLEGDESGYLRLEGDAVDGEVCRLKLGGDEQDFVSPFTNRVGSGATVSHTKRVTL